MKHKESGLNSSPCKTEEMLKQEARAKVAIQAEQEAQRPPLSPWKKKADNFWYHYKWSVIAGVAVVCLALFLVRDLVFRTIPDATVILVTEHPRSASEIDALESLLSHAVNDRNGDGKQVVTVDQIPFSSREPDQRTDADQGATEPMEYANTMKLTTVLAAGSDPLFLLDEQAFHHLAELGGWEFFQPLAGIPGALDVRLPISSTRLAMAPDLAGLEGYVFCIRDTSRATKAESEMLEHCRSLLEQLGAP